MLKKILAFSMSTLMILGIFTACGADKSTETAPTTIAEPPAPTEPAEEAKVLKVLTLGHSLAVDTGHMLNLVAATEGIGEYEEILIGTL